MLLSKRPQPPQTQAASSTAAMVTFGILMVLIVCIAWGIARESRKVIQRLDIWSALMERIRRWQKYLCLFALLLLVVRAFEGIGGVLKLLGTVICWPILATSQKIRELLKRTYRQNPAIYRQSSGGMTREIPLFARAALLLVEERSREYLVGDLEEEYWTLIVPIRSRFEARCWWWRQILGILTAYLWKQLNRTLGRSAISKLRRQ
jgi:hypothetical protein